MFSPYVPTIRPVKQSCKLAAMLMPDGDTWLYDVRKTDNKEVDRSVIFIYDDGRKFKGYV